jgi:hypothetical protein
MSRRHEKSCSFSIYEISREREREKLFYIFLWIGGECEENRGEGRKVKKV